MPALKPEVKITGELQKTLNEKNAFIDSLLKQFENDFGVISKDILGQLKIAYANGQWSYETVMGIFQDVGYDDTIAGYVEQYAETMKFIKREAQYMGVDFALSEKGLDLIGFMQEQNLQGLMKTKEKIAQTLVETGVRHTVDGTGFNLLAADLAGEIEKLGRNSKIEVSEGIKLFDRAVHSEQMKEAGIALLVYVGPDDDATRPACAAVLHDPRQETGWTRDEINALPDVSLVGGGGWNCRHDWYPYIEEYE